VIEPLKSIEEVAAMVAEYIEAVTAGDVERSNFALSELLDSYRALYERVGQLEHAALLAELDGLQ
jgi:hypothetical protein